MILRQVLEIQTLGLGLGLGLQLELRLGFRRNHESINQQFRRNHATFRAPQSALCAPQSSVLRNPLCSAILNHTKSIQQHYSRKQEN